MKVTFSPRAVSQINQAFDYIAQDNPAAADAFMARVGSLSALLAERPGIGRSTSKAGVRLIGLLPYPYLMFFKVLPERDEIRVVRVRHMSRRDAASARGL